MNTQLNDGGPAFPRPASEYEPNGMRTDGKIAAVPFTGMSLRDYMMIHAPEKEIESCIPETAGELSQWLGVENYTWIEHYPMAIAKARGIWADAMLADRERKEGDQ